MFKVHCTSNLYNLFQNKTLCIVAKPSLEQLKYANYKKGKQVIKVNYICIWRFSVCMSITCMLCRKRCL